MSEILLTIAIPAYNRPTELNDVIKKMQPLYGNSIIEILVVDDGSVPKLELENPLEMDQVNLVRNIRNIGFFENFFKIIDIAQGKYILFLNDDDFLVLKNIPLLIEKLKSSTAAFISTQFLRDGSLYRGKVNSANIPISSFFESSAHSPGLIFRKSETKENADIIRCLNINKSLHIYPQVLLVILAIAKAQEIRWCNLEIAREGYDRPTGQSPDDRGYWTAEERWSQFVAFSEVLNKFKELPGVSPNNINLINRSLNQLAAKQLASGMLLDIKKTTVMFWLLFLTRVLKNIVIKVKRAIIK